MTKKVFIDEAKKIVYSKVEILDQRIVNNELALDTISLLKEILPKYDSKELSRCLQKINDELKEKKSVFTLQRYKRKFYPDDVYMAGWLIQFAESPEILEPVIIFSKKTKIDANNTIKALSFWEKRVKGSVNDDELLIQRLAETTGYVAKILEAYSGLCEIEGSRYLFFEDYLAENHKTKHYFPTCVNDTKYYDLQNKVCTKNSQDVISYLGKIQ